jgi:hypothetical protein
MKEKIKLASLVIISVEMLFLLSGCENKRKDSAETGAKLPVIDVEYAFKHLNDEKMNFSEFIEDITYLSMETNEKSIIGGRHDPVWNITDNYIFAGEQMFNKEGRYMRNLGQRGQGPDEYIGSRGMTVDEKRKEFFVYDNSKPNINIYDFENNFKKKIKVHPSGSGIYSIGNGKILLSRARGYFFDNFFEYQLVDTEKDSVLYTRDLGIIENGHEEKGVSLGMDGNLIWAYNHQVSYYEFNSDTIFSLKEGIIDTPRFIVNTGKYKCTLDVIHNASRSDFDAGNYLSIRPFFESKQYLFFGVRYKKTLYYAAYNKMTGKIRMSKFDKFFNNDIDGGFLWLFLSTMNGEDGYNYILPDVAKEKIDMLGKQNRGYSEEKNRKLREFIENLEDDDNPFIVFYKLK